MADCARCQATGLTLVTFASLGVAELEPSPSGRLAIDEDGIREAKAGDRRMTVHVCGAAKK
jgi:hypothetical protein